MAGERKLHLPPVTGSLLFFDEFLFDQAVDQPDRRVWGNLEPFGQVAHIHGSAGFRVESLDGEERLMLLRRETGRDGGGLAET